MKRFLFPAGFLSGAWPDDQQQADSRKARRDAKQPRPDTRPVAGRGNLVIDDPSPVIAAVCHILMDSHIFIPDHVSGRNIFHDVILIHIRIKPFIVFPLRVTDDLLGKILCDNLPVLVIQVPVDAGECLSAPDFGKGKVVGIIR